MQALASTRTASFGVMNNSGSIPQVSCDSPYSKLQYTIRPLESPYNYSVQIFMTIMICSTVAHGTISRQQDYFDRVMQHLVFLLVTIAADEWRAGSHLAQLLLHHALHT